MAADLELAFGAWALGVVAADAALARVRCEPNVLTVALVIWTAGAVVFGGLGLAVPLLGIALVGCLGAVVTSAASAVVVLIAALLIRPWEMVGAPAACGAMPRALAFLAVARFGIEAVVYSRGEGRRGLHLSVETGLFVALYGWFILATALAGGVEYLGRVEFGAIFPILVIVVLVPSVCNSAATLDLLRRGITVAVIGAISAAFFRPDPPTDVAILDGDRLFGSGLFGNSNDLAALAAIGLPLLIVPLGRQTVSWGKLWGWLGALVLLVGVWGTQSRGAVMGLGVGALTYLLVGSGRRWRLAFGAAAVVGAITLFFGTVTRNEADLSGSQSSRWNYVVAGVRMARSSPLWGVGMGNYPRRYEEFTPAFAEWGERTAHSSWILPLAESGILGGALFLAFSACIWFRAWCLRGVAPEWLVVATTYGVVMSFLSHTYTLLPYLVAAAVLSAARVHQPAKTTVAPLRPRSRGCAEPPWRRGTGCSRGGSAAAERSSKVV